MILLIKTRIEVLMAACLFSLTGFAWAAVPVGEVTLVIGAARVVGETGNSAHVQRGLPVFAGDRIETEEGGHVHLRFADGAMVSVRPGSRLHIETYRYDSANPQDSAIRLQLERGVARSITGKGGEASRERFRLNTPIAAIGIKGTDFVVQATSEDVRVAVLSGAIVMAPVGVGCTMDAFGPCRTDAARTLSADMGRVMLELNRQQGVMRVVPVSTQLQVERLPQAERAPQPNNEVPRLSPTNRSEATAEALAVKTVEIGRGMDAVTVTPPEPLPTPTPPVAVVTPPKPVPPPVLVPEVVAPLPPPVVVPEVVTPPEPTQPSVLVWGHWPWSTPLKGDSVSISYAAGQAGGAREMVAGNDYYLLFRPVGDPRATLPTSPGQVAFSLRDSQVHFVQKDGVALPGSSRDGWLNVDFRTRQFDTGMTLSQNQAPASSTQLSAAGSIDSTGRFVQNATGTKLAGALTLDGKEAGYTFVRDIATGKYVGIARWVR
jgi:hypothetical protein